MANTAEEARRHARTMREIKLYGVADAMDNYAALLEAQPELLRRLRAAEADAERLNALERMSATVYHQRDPEYDNEPMHWTVVDESNFRARQGCTGDSLRDAIDDAIDAARGRK